MRKTERRITLIMTLAILFFQCLPVRASQAQLMTTEKEEQLSEVLFGVELQKDLLGLEKVDFSQLFICTPVNTYCLINNRFVEDVRLYPIMYKGETVFFALENCGGFQITTAMVDVLNEYIVGGMDFCLVYDRNACYLYIEGSFSKLVTSEVPIENRDILDVEDSVSDNNELETLRQNNVLPLDYDRRVERAETYIGCNVAYVKQEPGTDICWAAAVACIVNYKTKSSLTATDVVLDYGTGSSGLKDVFIPSVFEKYGLIYSFREAAPSNNVISNNLRQDYPVYGSFIVNASSRHSTVIYGINVVGGYIYIMDPLIGFTSATMQNGKYAYVNPTNLSVLTLDRAVCHSW